MKKLLGLLLLLVASNIHAQITLTFESNLQQYGYKSDRIVVENKTKNVSIELSEDDVLYLGEELQVTTAIGAVNNTDNFIVAFPQPAKGELDLFCNMLQEGETKVSILSVAGEELFNRKLLLSQGKNVVKVNLPQGNFIIQVTGENYAHTKQVISTEDGGLSISLKGKKEKFSNHLLKSEEENYTLDFDRGDELLVTGYYSDLYCYAYDLYQFNFIIPDIMRIFIGWENYLKLELQKI